MKKLWIILKDAIAAAFDTKRPMPHQDVKSTKSGRLYIDPEVAFRRAHGKD